MVKSVKEQYIQLCCDFYNEHSPKDKAWFGRMYDQCQEDYEQQNRCMYRWQFPLMILKKQQAVIDELKNRINEVSKEIHSDCDDKIEVVNSRRAYVDINWLDDTLMGKHD